MSDVDDRVRVASTQLVIARGAVVTGDATWPLARTDVRSAYQTAGVSAGTVRR